MANAVDFILSEHRIFRDKYNIYRESVGEEKIVLAKEIFNFLLAHSTLEEVFFARLNERGKASFISEAEHEDGFISVLGEELKVVSGDHNYYRKLDNLLMAIWKHLEKEEAYLLPRVAGFFTEGELDEIGEEMEKRRRGAV